MRKNERVVTERWLKRARIGHLGTSGRKGVPLVVPVCFVYDGDAIYSVIDRKPKRKQPEALRRLVNILENPNACLVVDEYHEDWKRLKYIIIQGKARVLTRGEEYLSAISQLRKKYRQYRYMRLMSRPIIKIAPRRIIVWSYERTQNTQAKRI